MKSGSGFNEKDKAMHAWYYWGIADALDDLKEHLYLQRIYYALPDRIRSGDMRSMKQEVHWL